MALKRSLNVGVVGIGRVGGPLLTNIAFKARNSLYLQVHSRDRAKASAVVEKLQRDGAQVAVRMHDQYSTFTKWCDVIVSCLKDEEAQQAVMLHREDALLRNAKRGQIIIDHTTVGADVARECYEAAQRRGAAYLDAPLAGTLEQARSGMLVAMVGGDKAAYDKVETLLRLYAENAQFMGPPGSGSAAKSITQSLVAMHAAAAAEAVVLADAMGCQEMDRLLSVLDASMASSAMLRRCGGSMTRLLRNPEEIPDESPMNIDGLLRDLSIARAAARDVPETALPLFTTARSAFARASQAGVGDRDVSSVVHFLEGAGLPEGAEPTSPSETGGESPFGGGQEFH